MYKLAQIQIYKWRYNSENTQHIGPMALDFYDVFAVGKNDKTIAMVDADGVSIAAIKALHLEKISNKSKFRSKNRHCTDSVLKFTC